MTQKLIAALLRLALCRMNCVLLLVFSLALAPRAPGAQTQSRKVSVAVIDENGVPVAAARVLLAPGQAEPAHRCETDSAGRCELVGVVPGAYRLRVEKEGFYAATRNDVSLEAGETLEVTLNHTQEFSEVVRVTYSPPAIDPAETASSESLSSSEIINLPYPTTRDFRFALPLLPGVVPDATRQVHVNGAAAHETFDQLDGFNIAHPVTGLLDMRVSIDALRAMEVLGSRTSAELGKGSGGAIRLETGMGDDRYRFSATNFVPSFQTTKGFHINNWTPRATFSGPLRKGRVWFYEAADGEYDLNIFEELPKGADRNPVWRLNNLFKTQVNLRPGNILTVGVLVNRFQAAHAGLSPLDPLETTRRETQTAYLITLKDQIYLASGVLLELGFGASQFRAGEQPLGTQPYVIRPEGTSGNFFRTSADRARRWQWIATLTWASLRWHGRHELKLGTDLDRLTDNLSRERRALTILREDGTLAERGTFIGRPRFGKNNFEASGFVQDRWSYSDRWLFELGLRLDWDAIVRRELVSPRIAATRVLTRDGETKLSLGIGTVYDATNLALFLLPLGGRREDQFFLSDGVTPVGPPMETSFTAPERGLRAPRFLNWSVALERKLPVEVFLRAEFLEKRGHDGFAYFTTSSGSAGPPGGQFELRNTRQNRYDSLQVSARRALKGNHVVFLSYTRSAARSNAALDFNLDNPLFAQQAGGRLTWDAPNRLLSWAWLPLVKRFDLAYSLEWRDGFPFLVVNQEQQLVGRPDAHRFPDYFSLNLHLERRFRMLGFQWALRGGFDNLTNHQNPTVVNNNVDSPQFLTFSGSSHRAFTGRIRFLGRK